MTLSQNHDTSSGHSNPCVQKELPIFLHKKAPTDGRTDRQVDSYIHPPLYLQGSVYNKDGES